MPNFDIIISRLDMKGAKINGCQEESDKDSSNTN